MKILADKQFRILISVLTVFCFAIGAANMLSAAPLELSGNRWNDAPPGAKTIDEVWATGQHSAKVPSGALGEPSPISQLSLTNP